jgi:pimeloyl-ACP methyl ester carboxylesterase
MYIGFGVLERHDANLWAHYIARRFGPAHRIILSGLSMGASTVLMALSLPLPENVCGIVADSAFSSPFDIIQNEIHTSFHISGKRIVRGIDFWCRRKAGYALDELSTLDAVKGTTIPILFAHCTADTRVPVSMTLKAAECAAGETILLITEGGAHGCSYVLDNERYIPALQDLCSRKE